MTPDIPLAFATHMKYNLLILFWPNPDLNPNHKLIGLSLTCLRLSSDRQEEMSNKGTGRPRQLEKSNAK